MNREIKFRAWSTLEKVMFEAVDIWEMLDMAKQASSFQIAKDNLVLMQFTGLKDKNGKEIYEGDVLQTPDNHLAEVIFEDGCFKVNVHERGEVFWKAHYSFEQLKEETDWKEIEVIGNLYENADLLKV